MVATRSQGDNTKNGTAGIDPKVDNHAGEKRSPPPSSGAGNGEKPSKKAKKEQERAEKQEFEIAVQGEPTADSKSQSKEEDTQGELGTKDEIKQAAKDAEDELSEESAKSKASKASTSVHEDTVEDRKDEVAREEKKEGQSAQAGDDEPRHGTLESGHIYFLYRPKVETDEAESLDDISKFHILLIPQSGPHSKSHYHRIIEVGKKKLPDPGAKHQVIWGLVGGVGNDKSSLKDSFGAYTYETKTRGTRHQAAARPAARGHYIFHSPRDELADSPDHNRQRDYKSLLVYEITTPAHDDFGTVQKELGIEEKGAVVLQVKDPDAESRGNPRAAGIPRDKRAQYPKNLLDIFRGRRFIPANPISLLDYQGAELLIITSPHELHDSLGKNGEKVEDDLDHDAKVEKVDIDESLKELGLNKQDLPEDALEGHWV
ncbi:uncharacterized protein I303_102790 [Kwoniella dejecticola CBS 10117]|uniref:Uncharacterized protein n=1 Tax=Kwoniella dejecticola CBS 10117 TaxID=1296121 RepID=A0A1A6A9Q5_9TREE|nr:uncharacterized protein I303_02805 [Kwoniella dejecticola CBS 10117]OBR86790.1 hypothetical protein I303_02805 [Kwoniella dejecticola CBS 10117]